MNLTKTLTGTTAPTFYLSEATWKGQEIWVNSYFPPCQVHQLEVMHHLDDEGRHYCPTGYLWCADCCGTADEPEPPECTLAGKR